LINNSIANRRADMAITIHLCRGNAFSAHFAKWGYETVADHMFNLSKVDGYFLEYDDERSGNFSPLRFVPKDKKIMLGLTSSKKPQLETSAQIVRRIEEASKFVPLEQLCLSPQCGFSSSTHGANLITEDVENAKLELVIKIAEEVWR
jgi:5-methyltetrahydropteroyltriglutamate--homocysteine methyltransferase